MPREIHLGFDRRFFILGVFVLLFALGTIAGPRGDAGWRLVITQQMLAFRRLHLPEQPDQPGLIRTPDGWTSYFAIGQTLLFIPFEVAGKILSFLPSFPGGRNFPTVYLYCPIIGVVYFLALVAVLEEFGLVARSAAIASLVFTFCSLVGYYVAQSFQEEAVASVFVCLSLRAALRWRRFQEKRYAFEASLFGASVLLFRLNGVFALMPIGVLLAEGLHTAGIASVRARQGVVAAVLGAVGPAATHGLFAYLRFGNPFSTGYDQRFFNLLWSASHPVATGTYTATAFSLGDAFQIVINLFFGLGKGLFIYSPLLFIALWGFWIKRRSLAGYGVACVLALAASATLGVSMFHEALDGCWSWGARYQVHLLPLFTYPTWTGIRDLLTRRTGKVLVVTAAAVGLFVNLCAVTGEDRVEYLQIEPRYKNDQIICRVVREHQVLLRLANISTFIREGDALKKDEALNAEFATLWGFRAAAVRSGWRRNLAIIIWLGFFAASGFCFYRALRISPATNGDRAAGT